MEPGRCGARVVTWCTMRCMVDGSRSTMPASAMTRWGSSWWLPLPGRLPLPVSQSRGRLGGLWEALPCLWAAPSMTEKKAASSFRRRSSSTLSFRHASSVHASLWHGSCAATVSFGRDESMALPAVA